MECSDEICKFATRSCAQVVPNKLNPLQIRLYDSRSSVELSIEHQDLLVDFNGKCHIGLIKSFTDHTFTWQIGTVLMKKYYVIYDMTPLDIGGQNFI